MRDIGRMGENIFQFWCNSVGLTANGSKVDKRGWDCFVEFPNNSSGVIPRDLVPKPIECKVQVKSTDLKKKGEDIKLSNLESLVENPNDLCSFALLNLMAQMIRKLLTWFMLAKK
ncbi:MAG: hypothetical protein HC894_24655 [Microcoleus sp. SM1_3_4]|nr:hypothetical protein [Microcoleus sp. SM1_3_4]